MFRRRFYVIRLLWGTLFILSTFISPLIGGVAAHATTSPPLQEGTTDAPPPELEMLSSTVTPVPVSVELSSPVTHTVHLRSREFVPQESEVHALQQLANQAVDGRMHVLLQLDYIPRRAAKEALAAQGIELLAYVPDYAWIASVPATSVATLLKTPGLTWVGQFTAQDKLAPAIRADHWDTFNAQGDQVAVFVSLHQDETLDTGRKLVKAHGGRVMGEVQGINTLIVVIRKSNLEALAAEDAIQWIEPAGPPLTANNDGIRAQIGVDTVNAVPYDLDGDGVDVLVYDVGQVGDHPDFGSRLTHGDTTDVADHSTHVAGTLGGDGSRSSSAGGSANQWRGMAPAVDIISYGFEWNGSGMWFYDNPGDIEHDWAQAQNSYGADIGTASIGSNISIYFSGSCDLLGNYGQTARLMDQIVRGGNSSVGLGDKYIATWSVGNERGGSYCATNPAGYRKVAPPGAAKNPIHVGASNTDDNSMTTFSSWGPTDDGRLKPLIVAGGDQVGGDGAIKSTIPDVFTDRTSRNCDGSGDDYCYPYDTMAGTSMATPAIAGSIALMLQEYRAVYYTSGNFWPSTAKVILMQTAQDMGRPGPDYQWGYGQANIQAAIDLINRRAFRQDSVDSGEVDVFYFVVPDDDDPVTVSLAWDDYEATVNANPALINNLDLELVAPDGTVWRPWVLSPSNPTANATRGVDNINNQEQVQVFATDEDLIGTWIVRVKGTTVPQGPQDYSLACEGCESLDLGVCQYKVSGVSSLAPTPTSLEATAPQMEQSRPMSAGELWQESLEASLHPAATADQSIAQASALIASAWEIGPQAVLDIGETLTGAARDKLHDEIERARAQLYAAASPPPSDAHPVSEAEEQADAEKVLSEAQSAPSRIVRTDANENSGEPIPVRVTEVSLRRPSADLTVGDGCTYSTIGAAIAAASSGDRILIAGGETFTENLTVNITLTLEGGYTGCTSGSGAKTIVDGGGNGGVFIITRGVSVTLRNLEITNGDSSGEGGGIEFAGGSGGYAGQLILNNIELHHNQAVWGGGLWVGPGGEVSGQTVDIHDNTASKYGGGVRLYGSTITFNSNSNIYSNSATDGGGIYASREEDISPQVNLPSTTDVYNNTSSGDGGGVYLYQGNISLTDCSDIYSNDATDGGGAYLITSTLTMNGSCSEIELNTASGKGGGIYASGSSVNLDDSGSVENNSAGDAGGGLCLKSSDLYANEGTILYNHSDSNGGGIYALDGSFVDMDLGGYSCLNQKCSRLEHNSASSYGGGIYSNDSTVWLDSTYVTDNAGSYGGGIYAYKSFVQADSTLFSRNNSVDGVGDAIRLFSSSTLNSTNSTWAYNDSGGTATGRAIDLSSSSVNLQCSIIWGHTSSINTSDENVTYSDIEGGYAGEGNLDTNPLFVSSTNDYHLQTGSPLIDRCVSGKTNDIDGESRPIARNTGASPYDMGADEVSGAARVGIDGSCQYATLQQAINAAEDGDTLRVSSGVYFENVDIDDKDITIVGGYSSDCTITSTDVTRIEGSVEHESTLHVSGSTVTLQDLDIAWGDSNFGGGLYVGNSRVTLDDVNLHDNHGAYGGGMYISSNSVLTATGSTYISDNVATDSYGGGGSRIWGTFIGENGLQINSNCAPNGGGLYIPGGETYLDHAIISSNKAAADDGKGGGVYVAANGIISSTESYFILNSAYDGGSIYADASTVRSEGDSFGWNFAEHYGGAVHLTNNSTLHADDLTVGYIFYMPGFTWAYWNTAKRGGGIYAKDSTLEIDDSRISINTAQERGGGLCLDDSTLRMTSSVVGRHGDTGGNNVSTGYHGGGIALEGGTAVLSDTTIVSNTVSSSFAYGGGIFLVNGALTLTNSTVRDHALTGVYGYGAGIYASDSTIALDHSEILSNTAGNRGGGIRAYGSSVKVFNDSTIAYNHADGPGGGIATVDGSQLYISDTTLQNNTAGDRGGALYLDSGTLSFTGWWDIRDNSAALSGGAIYAGTSAGVSFQATDPSHISYLSDNQANGGNGGGLYVDSSTSTLPIYALNDSQIAISSNTTLTNGGAIAVDSSTLLLLYGDVQITDNSAGDKGGAIYLDNGAGTWAVAAGEKRPQFISNTAQQGGAIYASKGSSLYCVGTDFGSESNGNRATTGGGGAIYVSESTFGLYDVTVRNSQAGGFGGAIRVYSSTVTLNHTLLSGNHAQRGGAIYQEGDGTVSKIENTLIYSNTVSQSYGSGIRSTAGVLTLTHVTLADNAGGAAVSLSSGTGAVHDTIAWGNYLGFWGTYVTTTCNIDQGGNVGTNVDPRFIGNGDYHLRGDSPAVDLCSTGLDKDLDDISRPIGDGYDAGAYEYPYAMTFVTDSVGSGVPLQVVSHTHTLGNLGGVTDTYTLTGRSALGWPVTIIPTMTLPSAVTATVIAYVTIPADTLSGTVDTAIFTATSASDPYLHQQVVDTTTVKFAPQAAFAPDSTTVGAAPGQTYHYQHTLTNTGNYTDVFDLVYTTDQGWGNLLTSGPITLGPRLTTTVGVDVFVTSGGSGKSDHTVVTATTDGGAQASVLDITSAFTPSIAFAADHSQTVAHGTVVTYTHYLTNTGNATDTLHVAIHSSRGWASLLNSGPFELAAGQMQTVRVRIVVPSGAGGLQDTTLITATSDGGAEPRTVHDVTSVPTADLAFAPDHTEHIPAGDVITYTHILTNTGGATDVYDVGLASSSQGWSTLLITSPITLSAGHTAIVQVRVAVPLGSGGLTEVAVVTATSRAGSLSHIAGTVTDTVTAIRAYGLAFTPNHAQTIIPEHTITYTHRLTNTGNGSDTFTLAFHSSRGWATLLDSGPFALNAGESITVRVRATTPAGSGGLTDVSTIQASSVLSPSVSRTVTDTTISYYVPGVVLTPSFTFNAPAGATVEYTHWLTNTGNGQEQFDLTFDSSLGWSSLANPGPFTLDAGEGITVRVQVHVPLASGGLTDTAHLTATARTGGVAESVTDKTHVTQYAGAGLTPDYTVSAPPGEDHYFIHFLSNTGNGLDTFDVNISSSLGWASLDTSTPITLAPGESTQVVVVVHVPTGVISGSLTNVTSLTATSRFDPSVQDSAYNTTTVGFVPGVSFTPDHLTTGALASHTYAYTHTLLNEGNYTDTFTVTAHSTNGWGSLLTPANVELAAGAQTTVLVQVSVPADGSGKFDTTVVTATSQGGAGPVTVRDATAVFTPGVTFTADGSKSALPGQSVVYTHTLTNTGTSTDTINISLNSSQGWATLLDSGPFVLASGAITTVRVQISLPVGTGGLADTTVITATTLSGGGPKAAVTDHITVTYNAGVDIAPDYARTVPAGGSVIYTHQVTNTGNGTAVITFTLNSSRGWATLLDSGPYTMPAGMMANVRVQVSVPPTATAATQDHTTITAQTSGASDSASDTTTVSCTALSGVSFSLTPTIVLPNQSVSFQGAVLIGSQPISYTWDFGDGHSAVGQTVTHAYATEGTFSVVMSARNTCSGPVTATRSVIVRADPDITLSPAALSAILRTGEAITRTLIIGNDGHDTLNWSLAESPAVAWLTEASSSGATAPAHNDTVAVRFNATGLSNGVYSTTLRVTSDDPDEPVLTVPVTLTVSATACEPPGGAAFIYAPASPAVGQSVHFTGTVGAGSLPLTYTWAFGDGGTANGQTVTHTYGTAATYGVTLTVANPCGSPASVIHSLTVTGPTTSFIYLPLILRQF